MLNGVQIWKKHIAPWCQFVIDFLEALLNFLNGFIHDFEVFWLGRWKKLCTLRSIHILQRLRIELRKQVGASEFWCFANVCARCFRLHETCLFGNHHNHLATFIFNISRIRYDNLVLIVSAFTWVSRTQLPTDIFMASYIHIPWIILLSAISEFWWTIN